MTAKTCVVIPLLCHDVALKMGIYYPKTGLNIMIHEQKLRGYSITETNEMFELIILLEPYSGVKQVAFVLDVAL